MCEYCGCQDVPAIAELTAEHDRLRELARDLYRFAEAGDVRAARRAAATMRAVLGPHTTVEELGLFPLLSGEFPDQMAALVGEHHAIDSALMELSDAVTPSATWPQLARSAITALFEHILREQDGVFPAALATLTADDWDEVAGVRERSRTSDHQLR